MRDEPQRSQLSPNPSPPTPATCCSAGRPRGTGSRSARASAGRGRPASSSASSAARTCRRSARRRCPTTRGPAPPRAGARRVVARVDHDGRSSTRCTESIGDHGWPAVFFLMLLESACIPVPSEAIMLFAGFLVSQHQMGFVEAMLAGTLGNLVGSDRLGRRRLRRPAVHRPLRHATCTSRSAGRWPTAGSIATATGSSSGRAHAADRPHLHLAAGGRRADAVLALRLYTFLGALPWCTALCALGVAVGPHWETLGGPAEVPRLPRRRGADRRRRVSRPQVATSGRGVR